MTPERKQRMLQVLDQRQADLVLVLENVEDPYNIGAVLRSADSVGIQKIYIIQTLRHPSRDLKVRSAVSAQKWMSVDYFDSVKTCMEQLKQEGFSIWATHLNSEARSLYDMDFTQKIAMVFGNERSGVSRELLSYCEGNFLVPQVGMIKSLNISVACAVSLYEAFRQRRVQNTGQSKGLDTATKKILWDEWTARYAEK